MCRMKMLLLRKDPNRSLILRNKSEDENYTLGQGSMREPQSEGSYMGTQGPTEGAVSGSSFGFTIRHLEDQKF